MMNCLQFLMDGSRYGLMNLMEMKLTIRNGHTTLETGAGGTMNFSITRSNARKMPELRMAI